MYRLSLQNGAQELLSARLWRGSFKTSLGGPSPDDLASIDDEQPNGDIACKLDSMCNDQIDI